jgi:hypothetical protein
LYAAYYISQQNPDRSAALDALPISSHSKGIKKEIDYEAQFKPKK